MKKTPLYQWHVDNGANMAEFAAYSMPLWYPEGARNEHLTVIQHCGLFDTSHMAAIAVEGPGGHDLLQRTFSKDLDSCLPPGRRPLAEGRCVYGVFLNDAGHVIDDAIVYKRDEETHLIIVNAGMGAPVSSHLQSVEPNRHVRVVDLTDRIGKIDIQGPASAAVLKKIIQHPEEVFADMKYFSFKGWYENSPQKDVLLKDGTPVLLSRTGYTGEFGFELFVAPESLVSVWNSLLEIGEGAILPCGLAARDSLRAGAVLPLSHQDIGDWPFARNPWMFALPLDESGSFTKSFIGSEALRNLGDIPYTYAFAGYDPRKIPAGSESVVVDADDNRLGDILTCATDMAIGRVDDRIVSIASGGEAGKPEEFRPKGLSCGFVRVGKELSVGEKVFLKAGKRRIEVEIRKDVRPDRTARRPLQEMIDY